MRAGYRRQVGQQNGVGVVVLALDKALENTDLLRG